ncbi:MAG: amidase, partial [Candidatus Bathyarchaeota archaeon]|nr:amidase [Candidatus Bathyarchaeota archaeon]
MKNTKEDYIRWYLDSAKKLGIPLEPLTQSIVKTAEAASAVDSYEVEPSDEPAEKSPRRSEASKMIKNGELTPKDLVESLLERIKELEPKLDAWVTVDTEGALKAAKALTIEAQKGSLRSPLHGIAVGIKDIYATKALRTTMGSPIYHDHVPDRDSNVVARLKEAGAIILGKTETTEFAYLDPAPTRNPWNTSYTPGGSSSGSAAAVAARMCPLAFGTQTGGSVMRPASFCGVAAMKPTHDLLSREGIYPQSWSLDHVGFMSRSVEDLKLVLGALTGVQTQSIVRKPRI